MIKIPEKYLKPLDYLFIFRPTLFFPVWIVTLSGLSGAMYYNNNPVWWNYQVEFTNILAFIFITLATGASFILNQVRDIETDKINQKLFLISEGHVSVEIANKIAFGAIIVSLAGLLFIDYKIFLLMGLLVLFGGYIYNYPPFEWKNKPILGILVNFISGLFLFLSGWEMAGFGLKGAIVYSIPYLSAWTAVAILTTLPDKKGDEESDKVTISVKVSNRNTVLFASGWLIGCFLLSLYNQDPIISLPALLSIPLFIITIINPVNTWILRSIRFPILFLGLMLCCEYPLFFLVILANYYLGKVYYISRFNLDYPTFHVDEDTND